MSRRDHRMVFLSFAICHSVTPLENGHYIASSPDEIALVKFAEDGGVKLVKRTSEEMFIEI